MKLRTLDRYTLSECLPTFALSLTVFSFLLLTQRLAKLFDLIVAKGVPPGEVFTLLLLALPTLMPLLLPVSLLLAVVLAMGRLSADSEIVAMRACGVGLVGNLRPVLFLSTAVALSAAVVSLWLQPLSGQLFRQTLYDTVLGRINVSAESGTFTDLAPGVTLYAEKVDRRSGEIRGLFLHTDKKPLENATIFADRGTVHLSAEGVRLDLEKAQIHQSDPEGDAYRRITAEKSRLTIPLTFPTDLGGAVEEEPSGTILERAYFSGPPAQSASPAGTAAPKDFVAEARLEFNRRLALPTSCIVLGLLGAILGIHHSRVGKGRGVVLCLGVLLLNYTLLTLGKILGERAIWPPEAAMWMPNLVLGALAAYLFVRKNRERPLPLEHAINVAVARIRERFAKEEEEDEA